LGCLGTVEIVATASGKIIPSGRSRVIQPFEIGVVRAIRVHDGDTVKAGDVLIELDPTINAAEREHLQSDLIAAQLDVRACTQPWPTAPTRSPTFTRRREQARSSHGLARLVA
jgi:multidrug efflux pump subunit AcrA (membrane-fusion protein)